ncbi:hypothetical protein MKX70_01765 [Paenibacillus sp. FSL R7-0312]|uniref:hypothetical protein n=1 Tax=Paenibacillus sp. FSL R7-0312 TaxID=2921682 RepID=UPI0030F96C5A
MKLTFHNKKSRFILFLLILLMGIYFIFFGLPWKSSALKKQFEVYLENKYQIDFKLDKMEFDFIHLTYNSHAYPVSDPTLYFYVGQDIETKKIHDLYEYVLEKRKSGRR